MSRPFGPQWASMHPQKAATKTLCSSRQVLPLEVNRAWALNLEERCSSLKECKQRESRQRIEDSGCMDYCLAQFHYCRIEAEW